MKALVLMGGMSWESTLPYDQLINQTVREGLRKVGLLGTRFTMEQDFYRSRLENQHSLTVLIPPEPDRVRVHQIIYEELCLGEVKAASRQIYQRITADLQAQGAQAIILGCTEIAMLIQARHCALPLFDTTALHARSAALWALN